MASIYLISGKNAKKCDYNETVGLSMKNPAAKEQDHNHFAGQIIGTAKDLRSYKI
jgi:hypothetical protein